MPISIEFIAISISSYLVARALGWYGVISLILFMFVISLSIVMLCGYLLSEINLYGSALGWNLALLLVLVLSFCLSFYLRSRGGREIGFLPHYLSSKFKQSCSQFYRLEFENKISISTCLFMVIAVGVFNLYFVFKFYPHNWDSLAYHLPRMAYYIQRGSLEVFDSNYWAQTIHPKGSTNLLTFLYIGSGGNERMTQLGQYISYWMCALSIIGALMALGANFFSSVLPGVFFCLLTESLMESTTPQNDLLISSLVGIVIYGLMVWAKQGSRYHLGLSAIGLCLALSFKASVLLIIPSCGLIFLYAAHLRSAHLISTRYTENSDRKERLSQDVFIFLVSLVIGFCIFVLPSGYVDNIQIYGHPIGPTWVRQMHSFEGERISMVLQSGGLNLLRYASDFMSFDGIPNELVLGPQMVIKKLMIKISGAMGLDSAQESFTRVPFVFEKPATSNEDFSYWGALGFLLIWPVVIWLLFKRGNHGSGKIFAVAAVVFLIVQAFSGPYDPWRGRYFLSCAPFALIALGMWMNCHSSRFFRYYIALISIIASSSAAFAVAYKQPVNPMILAKIDRIGQLTSRHPERYTRQLKIYEHMIPPGSVVAISMPPDSPEYLFFGEKLTRRLIPINTFNRGMIDIPKEAQYLLFSHETSVQIKPVDVDIGEGLFLRRLQQE